MHSSEPNNIVKSWKSRKDIENTKKIWRSSGKCIQNSGWSLSQFETPWKLFLCNTRQEIVFFSELGKSCWSQNICLHENIAFSTKITIGNKLRKYQCTSISMTSYHRINRMNEETKTTFRSVGSWSNGAFYRNKVGLCSIVLKFTT